MQNDTSSTGERAREQRLVELVIGNGMLVLLIGLLAGVMLIFSLLGVVTVWPLPVWEVQVPGTVRGWSAAHVGGILNGVMIAGGAMLMRYLALTGRSALWVGWGLIYTGWANTVFYWAGNVAGNRGLSMIDTPYGSADVAGALAFLGGGTGMFFTIVAVVLLARAAFRGRAV